MLDHELKKRVADAFLMLLQERNPDGNHLSFSTSDFTTLLRTLSLDPDELRAVMKSLDLIPINDLSGSLHVNRAELEQASGSKG